MSEIKVNFGDRSYVITIGTGILRGLADAVVRGRRPTAVAVVSNPVVASHYAPVVMESLNVACLRSELIVVPPGERHKTLRTVARIYDALVDMKMDRAGAVVALGGGVVGDMAGFAAATYMRGIDCHQVPTTLLAMVDSSVGGKTGVDLPKGKNLVGAFHQPKSVLVDVDTLDTLPSRELRSGLAEVIKHGIIYDQEYFKYLDSNAPALLKRDKAVLAEAIRRSVEIKREVVQSDERESGLRAILNYGHTVGHAVEMLAGYGRYRHGEAVSVGMVTEAIIAEQTGNATVGLAREIASTLAAVKLPIRMDDKISTQGIIEAIMSDKKTLGGTLRMALPALIGECKVVEGIGTDAVAGAIETHRKEYY